MTTPGDERDREPAPRGRRPADTLSNRLMLARKLAGLSIREAADLCGLGRGAWTKWENGSRPLDLLEITGVIAERLDIDLEWLRFGGELAPARGVPVAKRLSRTPVDRADEFRQGYSQRPERPTSTRPKVRVDRTHPPAGPTVGRRPVRVGTARFADHAAVVINHG